MNNIVMIEEVERKFNYRFNNKSLVTQAFTRSSVSKFINNEFLETIGDSVIAYYFTKIYVDNYGFINNKTIENFENSFGLKKNKNEEDFTKAKSRVVSNERLAKIMDSLDLIDMLQIGQSDKDNNVLIEEKIKADLLESIIGAIAIDCNFDQKTLQEVVNSVINIDKYLEELDNEVIYIPDYNIDNSADLLQKLVDKGEFSKPIISEREVKINNNLKWECSINIDSLGISRKAVESNKSKAKKHAAYLILNEYYIIK